MEGNVGTASANYKYSEVVALSLRPSAMAGRVIASMGFGTLALLAAMPGPVAPRILAATWVTCVGLEAMARVALRRSANAAHALVLRVSGEIELAFADGRHIAGRLREGSFVAPFLTIIRWRAAGHRFDRTVLILPDMVAREEFRRLRVLLRWR
jgi:hypothetical protein